MWYRINTQTKNIKKKHIEVASFDDVNLNFNYKQGSYYVSYCKKLLFEITIY